jgi:plasmid stabilization system protein ParE
MRYRVEMTEAALDAIEEQARYIAVDRKSPLNAGKWLEKLWDTVDSLEFMPRRCPLAEEDAYRTYEVRRARVGDYLILFTIDEPAKTVWIIGFRHGGRLPRPRDLPDKPPRRNK